MNAELDWAEIYSTAKARWIETEAPRRSLRDMVAVSVPWWIGIVGLGLFLLSAPHTAGVFDQLTPGWGMVAPLTVEFGLLYAAFRRKVSDAMPPMLGLLQGLLFVTAILVNGAGAFSAVVSTSGIAGLSFAEIIERFGSLPAISQAALFMACLSALIVPVGAVAAGEGIAFLVLQHRSGSFLEARWQEAEGQVLYRAVFSRLNGNGLPAKEAARLARHEVKGYLGTGIKPETPRNEPENAGTSADAPARTRRGKGEAVAQLEALYGELSDIPPVSVIVAETGISKSTVYEWMSKRKMQDDDQRST